MMMFSSSYEEKEEEEQMTSQHTTITYSSKSTRTVLVVVAQLKIYYSFPSWILDPSVKDCLTRDLPNSSSSSVVVDPRHHLIKVLLCSRQTHQSLTGTTLILNYSIGSTSHSALRIMQWEKNSEHLQMFFKLGVIIISRFDERRIKLELSFELQPFYT